jgi:hypothetical protein
METLEFGKRDIHETRHTCPTMLAAAEVYDAKIARILGHSGKSIAENVYTHLDIQELIEAINKIKKEMSAGISFFTHFYLVSAIHRTIEKPRRMALWGVFLHICDDRKISAWRTAVRGGLP